MSTDATDVVTGQHIASFNAVIKGVEKHLKLVETKSKQGITYFQKSFKDLNETKEGLEARIAKMEAGIGKIHRQDNSVKTLIDDLKKFAKLVESEGKRQESTIFYFGKTKVANEKALLKKIKDELPDKAKGNASQALNDVVAGEEKTKEASKAGAGMRHASSGVKGVSSCTLFCKYKEINDGLDTEIKIEGVGSHEGSSSYKIHWSNIPSKLKEGSVFKL